MGTFISDGTGTNIPNASALLEVSTTVDGFLMPRMTSTQRDAIPVPATGLEIYNVTTSQPEFFDGTIWKESGAVTNPAGANTQIQFNDNGDFGSDANFVFNGTSVGIGTNTPVANAVLEINSTTKGFLPVRMTTVQRDAIPSPETSLEIYNTTTNQPEFFDGTIWKAASGTATNPAGANTQIQLNDNGSFGANADFVFTGSNVGIGTSTPVSLLEVKSLGDAQITITADSDNINENDNPTLLLSQDGNLINGLFGINGDPSPRFDGALTNAVFIEAKENAIANSIQFVTGGTTIGATNGSARMTIDTIGRIGVGTTTPNTSSLLDISSTSKGFLPPRMTTTQRNAIPTPASGLEIYNTTTNQPEFFNGSIWTFPTGGATDPGGLNTEIQFNDNGSFGGNNNFVFNGTSIGIGTNAPVANAAIEINSTTQGFLQPRMTTVQRDAIPLPATGLEIFNVTTNEPEFFNGTAWQKTVTNPAGTDTQIQFNDNGDFGANADFVFNGASLGIGTSTPDASAALEIDSTVSGFLPPRMTTTQRNAIPTPASGLEIYNTTTNQPEFFNGSIWTFPFTPVTNPAGTDTQIQLNDNGSFGANANFVFNGTSVGIGTSAPASSAILDLTSPSKGFLPPRMTTVQRNAITLAATGLQIHNSTTNEPEFFDGLLWRSTGATAVHGPNFSVQTNVFGIVFGNADFVFTGSRVGIGTSTPAASAVLEIDSTTKGFLQPRMTTSERDGISSPATGLEIYNTTTNQPEFFNGSIWTFPFTPVTNPAGTDTQIQFNDNGDFGANADFVFNGSSVGIGTNTPDTSAILEINSTTSGFLPPRMTSTQRDAIPVPATGLEIYNVTTSQPEFFDGTIWTSPFTPVTNPAGANTQIQLNDNGSFGANADFVFNGASVGIGTSTPDASSILDLSSTTQGFLPPRITTVQRDAIPVPAIGLEIYNTLTNQPEYFDGAIWRNTGATAVGGLNTQVQFNNNGKFAGISDVTTGGTGLSFADDALLTFGAASDFILKHISLTNKSLIASDNGDLEISADGGQLLLGSTVSNTILQAEGGNVGIGITPVASALLELNSTTQGFLPPRMTTIQRDAIVLPATGLEIYNTTTNEPEFFDGTSWSTSVVASLAETLAIGNTTGGNNIVVSVGDAVTFVDGAEARFGTSDDLIIRHSGVSTSMINAIGELLIKNTSGNNLQLKTDGTTAKIEARLGASTELVDFSVQNNFGADIFTVTGAGSVGIGANVINDASALLQMESTARGFLMPRMTTTQRDAISSPATGLEIYNLTTNHAEFFTGSAWSSQGSGAAAGNAGTVQFNESGDFAGAEGITITGSGFDLSLVDGSQIILGDSNDMIISHTSVFSIIKSFTGDLILKNDDATADTLIELGSTADATKFKVQSSALTDLFVVTAAGRVGIGVTVPDTEAILQLDSTTKGFLPPRMTTTQRDAIPTPPNGLEIYNLTTNEPEFFDGTSWSGSVVATLAETLLIGNTTGGTDIIVSVGDSINGAVDLILQSTGDNVGIGLELPDSKLHVQDNQNANTDIHLENTTVGTAATARIVVEADSGAMALTTYSSGFTTSGSLMADAAEIRANSSLSNGLNIVAQAVAPIRFYTNGVTSEKMRIESDGRVGIGTTAPDTKLHIQDGSAGIVEAIVFTTLTIERSGNNYISFLNPDASRSGINFGSPTAGNLDASIIYNDGDSGSLQFRSQGNILGLTIDSNQNVVINSGSIATLSGVAGTDLNIIVGDGTSGKGGDFNVSAGDGIAAVGGSISLTAGAGSGGFTAGSALLRGGDGFTRAGDALIEGGDGVTDGHGGDVLITGGNSAGSNQKTGGSISLTGGAGTGGNNGAGGDITLTAGSQAQINLTVSGVSNGGSDGSINLLSGAGSGGSPGSDITITTGVGSGGATGGTLALKAGEAVGTNDGGSVTIDAGNSSGAGGFGDVIIQGAGGSVGVGTSAIDTSALMQLNSTIKGFLPPRMAEAERDLISSPSAGLEIFNNNSNHNEIFDGNAWRKLAKVSTNTTEIFQESDWPNAPVSGVITIDSGRYSIKSGYITANRFEFATGSLVVLDWQTAITDQIVYVGTGTLFSGTPQFLVMFTALVTLAAPGATLFDITANPIVGAPSTAIFSINNCIFTSIAGNTIGTITNVRINSITDTAFQSFQEGLSFINAQPGILNTTFIMNGLGTSPIISANGFANDSLFDSLGFNTSQSQSLFFIDPDVTGFPDAGIIINNTRNTTSSPFYKTGTTGTFTAVTNAAVPAEIITSVTDSAGIARFNFTIGPTLFPGQEVTISGFVTNTAYNGSFFVTIVGAGFFEAEFIAFGSDETGSFLSNIVTITSTGHGFSAGQTMLITDTINYNGGAHIFNVNVNDFQINRTFIDDVSGEFDTGSLTETDPRMIASNNSKRPDSIVIAFGFININNGTTLINDGLYNAIEVIGFADNGITQRLTLVNPDLAIYRYDGLESLSGSITANLSATKIGSTVNYRFTTSINGAVPVFATTVFAPMEVKTTKVQITLTLPVQLEPGDTIQIMVAGDGTSDNITITDLLLSIQSIQ